MNKPTPRFEFRVFAPDLLLLEERMRRSSPVAVYRESLELYLVTEYNDACNPGCIAEVAQVLVNGAGVSTACLEAEDPDQVLSAAVELGLTGLENVNYLTAIKRIVGLAPLPADAYYRAL